MTERDTVFQDLPENCFPFDIEFIRLRDSVVVEKIHVSGPGAIDIQVPEEHKPVKVKMTFPTGDVVESLP